MTRGWRVFFGAACGALIVLCLHPISRPYVVNPLMHWGISHTFSDTNLILENNPVLPLPSDELDYSLWMQAGAKKISLKEDIKHGDFNKLIRVAHDASQHYVTNAYWRQMEAVFLNAAGRKTEATDVWIRASRCDSWDDFQSRRLKGIEQQLARESGGPAAWEYASVYPLRSTDPAHAIESLARELLKEADIRKQSDLALRYATLQNGRLLRDGARSISVGAVGATLVEIAAYPRETAPEGSPRKAVLTRTEFYHRLQRASMNDEAKSAVSAFTSNDGWLALTAREDIATRAREITAASLLTVTLPGAIFAVSLFGGVCWLGSILLKVRPELLMFFEPPIAPAMGLLLAALLYHATELPLASIAVVACFAFLAFTPVHERSHPPEQLGPIFELTLFTLGCVFAVLMSAFIMGNSTPGCQVLPQFNAPKEFYGGSTLFLGLCGIVLGLLLLAAPSWGMVQRISTPHVVVIACRQFGRGLFLACLAISIAITPVAVLVDNHIRAEVQQIVLNEPVYYLNQ